MTKKSVIAICASADFYRQVVDIDTKLSELGFKVIIPATASKMKETGDFAVSHYKTWFAQPGDYHKKAALMREHFEEIANADAILVVNNEKHGKPNYIGGNVLMEMGLAFYLKKKIFILNDIPEDSPFEEEIRGFEPIVLKGALEKIIV
ncbi:MAG: hypothetical protein V4702_00355 [Patescibacteria group bacterium]